MNETAFDPILLEVLKNGFEAIADEMALVLMRTAYSPIVRDSMDFSTALCDEDGENLAQGLTTPMHLGSFHDAMRHLITQYGADLAPGDLFIGNDPYLAAGQHLPDIYIIRPIFAATRLCGWAATIAHHIDVGGIVPGSNSLGATEIFQEGLRLPFLKLHARGQRQAPIFDILAANVRLPDLLMGDLHAQIAACEAGHRGLLALVDRYGADLLAEYAARLHEYAEQLARAAIAAIPDGSYHFCDTIDGLGDTPEPITLRLCLTITGTQAVADWTGTDAQIKGGINAPLSFCRSNVYAALRSVMPTDMPNCHGYTRPIRVIAPSGTLVNAVSPAPCGARGITGYRIADCMFGALAQAVPHLVAADGAGGSTLPTFAGHGPNGAWVFSECVMGVWGATARHDGQEGVPHMSSNQSNIPVEMIEAEYPIRIEHYGFVADTGGPGEYRGGVALARTYRALEDDMFLGLRSDKCLAPPFGLCGGQDGAAASNILDPHGDAVHLPPLPTRPITLQRGSVFRHVMAGGGGFGNPLDRAPAAVLRDVLDGKVSIAHAASAYGVVLTPDATRIDEPATESMRATRRGSPA
jgi:N-methylhydantoinase B